MPSNAVSILEQKISSAIEDVKPASESAISARLLKLEAAGMSYDSKIQNPAKVYWFALRNLPWVSIRHVTEKLISGEYPKHTRYIPIPAEMAALVRSHASALYDTLARLKLTSEALRGEPDKDPEELERERIAIRAMHQDYKGHMAQLRAEEQRQRRDHNEGDGNRLFRNKLPVEEQPHFDKWDDDKWRSQQEELENGNKAQSNSEGETRSGVHSRPEGHEKRDDFDPGF